MAPTAVIGDFDCDSLTAPVVLDNSGGTSAARFAVEVRPYAGTGPAGREVTVQPGEVVTVVVSLPDGTLSSVWVSVDGTDFVKDGGCFVSGPRAVVGEFDCDSLLVPVALDNTRSSQSVTFEFTLGYTYLDVAPDVTIREVLAAGETREVRVPIDDSTVTSVWVSVDGDKVLAKGVGPLCGLVTLGGVDCRTLAVPLALDNTSSYRNPRAFVVSSTEYPGNPRAFNELVVLPHGSSKQLSVPVRELLGGAVRVLELEGGVLFEEEVSPTCPPSVEPVVIPDPPGATETETLAATGAGDTLRLVLVGAGMIACGGLLMRITRVGGG